MEDNLEPLFDDPALRIDIKKNFNWLLDESKWRHELYMDIKIKEALELKKRKYDNFNY